MTLSPVPASQCDLNTATLAAQWWVGSSVCPPFVARGLPGNALPSFACMQSWQLATRQVTSGARPMACSVLACSASSSADGLKLRPGPGVRFALSGSVAFIECLQQYRTSAQVSPVTGTLSVLASPTLSPVAVTLCARPVNNYLLCR